MHEFEEMRRRRECEAAGGVVPHGLYEFGNHRAARCREECRIVGSRERRQTRLDGLRVKRRRPERYRPIDKREPQIARQGPIEVVFGDLTFGEKDGIRRHALRPRSRSRRHENA